MYRSAILPYTILKENSGKKMKCRSNIFILIRVVNKRIVNRGVTWVKGLINGDIYFVLISWGEKKIVFEKLIHNRS